jgi:serine/threonine-protein kinase HipA
MAFNVLAHNKDDHAKNFAFIHGNQGWELSPAYDLTFSHGMGGEHTTSAAGSGNPGPEKLMEIANAFRVNGAAQIVDEVRYAVSQWAALAKANGVSTNTIHEIGSALQNVSKRF